MRTLGLVLLVISVGFLRADPTNSAPAQTSTAPASNDWTVNGKTYHNVTVGAVEADQVHITYDGGIGSVPLAELPPDIQRQLGFDPQKAATAAQIRDLQAQVSDLTEQNAELRAELSRYKGALTETQAAPKIGVEAFHCYLFQTVTSASECMNSNRSGSVIAEGPFAGLTKEQAGGRALQAWAQLPEDQKQAYEKMAQQSGDPILQKRADDAAKPAQFIPGPIIEN